MSDWNKIKKEVESNDNVFTVSMIILRDATGKDKLGVNVVKEISKTLAGMGLGHVPQELPLSQSASVRLYKRGTPIGDLIEMVLLPSEANDRMLKEQFDKDAVNYASVIEKIRELVL